MPGLTVYLLGPPRVERDGVVLRLDRRKAVALLSYLAVTGQSHRRDSLANLLWPDSDAAKGRAALRRALHALKASLGGEWLAADRESIGLAPRRQIWVDVAQFRQHVAECEGHGHPASEVCSACAASLGAAVELVRGEFLAGFGLKDSANFDDWQLFEAEAVRRELGEALERLVWWHSRQREFEAALAYGSRRSALNPLDEGAHRDLMCLYAWTGRRSAALRQYDKCATTLRDQLGVAPLGATRRLRENIQAGHVPALPVVGESPVEPPSFLGAGREAERPVFVARQGELAQMDRFLELLLGGHGQVVFVTGEAGSGKTSLIHEFTRRALEAHGGTARGTPRRRPSATERPLVVAIGNCNAYTGLGDPYLPFREVLALLTGDVEARWAAGAMTREHVRRLWHTLPLAAQALAEGGPDLLDVFVSRGALLERAAAYAPGRVDWLARIERPVERRAPGASAAGPQQSDLFEQYTRVLQNLARQVPLVVVVDDLQWADLGSITLLFHMGRNLAGHRILLVGAYRPEEVAIGRAGERHPLEAVVNELQRIYGENAVNLDRAESQGFVEAFLDSEPNRLGTGFREMLYRQTRGHPLFTVELLRGLQERGDLVQDGEGQWVAGPALNWEALPARAEAAIRERIGRLADPLQAALRVASVEGDVFTAEVVARVLGADERSMVGELSSELDRRHRLVRADAIQRIGSHRASRYRFRNYLFQKYLYDSLDPVQRAYLHEDVGGVLEDLYGEQVEEIAVQLAWHFQEAGVTEKAICYLHQAGERAVRLSAFQEGLAHATRGLELLMSRPDTPERAQQELDLRLTLGFASMGVGVFTPESALDYARARDLGQQVGRVAELCQALGEMAVYHFVRSEHHRARELAEEALGLARRAADPLLEAWCQWQLGVSFFGLGDFVAAKEHLQKVVAHFASEPGRYSFGLLPLADAGLSAQAYAACCLWCLGYPEQAQEHSRAALALARELGDPFTLADVLCHGCCLFVQIRRDPGALHEHARELSRLAENIGTWQAPAAWHSGASLALQGKIEEGIALMRAGIEGHRSVGKLFDVPRTLGAVAVLQARAGRPGDALATLDEALTLVEETDERYCEADLHRLRADLLLIAGREGEAEACLHKAIDVARGQAARSWELRATTDLAHLWQAQGRAAEARQRLGAIYGWFREGFDTPDLKEARALLEELQ